MLPRDLSEARAIIASSNLDILVFTDIGMEPLLCVGLQSVRPGPMRLLGPPDDVRYSRPCIDYYVVMDAAEATEGIRGTRSN